MKNKTYPLYYIIVSLLSLGLCILAGILGGFQYIMPDFLKEILPFTALRPLHTLFALAWIFMASIGGIFWYMQKYEHYKENSSGIMKWQFWVFTLTGIIIAFCYVLRKFEGKEYLEFPHVFYIPILTGWILFGIYYFRSMLSSFRKWPVYYWMWGTGILMMVFHFTEAHLWILSYFREDYIQNLTMQWKAGGAYVGAWNMLVYGSSMYVMEKTSGDNRSSHTPIAFSLFFLGLVNVMFNWGHHLYPVPNAEWIRYFAYLVSMTEWIILLRIIYLWKKNLPQEKKKAYNISYKMMMLSDLWIFLNLIVALLISIPAINFFTHGTHITVAHSMGTIIGINTTILLSSIAYLLNGVRNFSERMEKQMKRGIRIFHISFIGFWLVLIFMGIERSRWIYFSENVLFGAFQDSMHIAHILFTILGIGIFVGLYILIYQLIQHIVLILKSES